MGTPHGTSSVVGPDLAFGARRPYTRPRLTTFGDVRDLTLGPTGGTGDTGSGFQVAPPFMYGGHSKVP